MCSQPHAIHATIARFYMMTNTILSEASLARPECCLQRAQWYWPAGRSEPSCPGGRTKSLYAPDESLEEIGTSLPDGNLIANLELKLRITRKQISDLEISNRKYIAIFYLTCRFHFWLSPQAPLTRLLPRPAARLVSPSMPLIYGGAIKNQAKPSRIFNLQNSNRR
jgi:hypothetical protein